MNLTGASLYSVQYGIGYARCVMKESILVRQVFTKDGNINTVQVRAYEKLKQFQSCDTNIQQYSPQVVKGGSWAGLHKIRYEATKR